MKDKKTDFFSIIIFLCVSVPLWLGLFCPAHAAEETAPPDAAQGAKALKPESGKEGPEKEYWCKRSSYYKKRIWQAQYEIDKEEALLSDLKDEASTGNGKDKKYVDKKIKKTQDNLTNANRLLKEREKDLARMKDEARKKNIPPEWLQCD